jgi:hypothetical protein
VEAVVLVLEMLTVLLVVMVVFRVEEEEEQITAVLVQLVVADKFFLHILVTMLLIHQVYLHQQVNPQV